MLIRRIHATLLLSLLLSLALPTSAKTIHVPADQPTIQAGINTASNGDTVLVSSGTYYENITFSGKAITLTSASGPGATIINGQQQGPVVTFTNNEQRTSVLSGFTITNGYGNFNAGYQGGGILMNGASPTIQGNVITSNGACAEGMGLAVSGGGPLIQNNIIHNNVQTGCSGGPGGGGIYVGGGVNMQIVGNIITNNSDYYGGGGGIAASGTGFVISNNVISGNQGGGISFQSNSGDGILVQNLITNNTYGAGLSWGEEPAVLVSNTITGNSPYYGGVSEVVAGNMDNLLTMENNLLIADDNFSALSCGNYNGSAPPVFTNNDVFSAAASAYDPSCPNLTGVNGNITADPLFIALLSNKYLLQSTSPAINAGNNAAPNLPSKDFAGDPRIVNTIVDIGVDEYTKKTVLSLSSYTLDYGPQAVGTSSTPQVVALTNQGARAVSFKLIATGSSFSQTNNCGASLVPGASCQFSVSFVPVGGGALPSVLGIFTDATLNPQVVFLNGTGLAPQVQFYSNFYFYNQLIGTSNTQTGTLTNVGQAPLLITSIAYSGATDFVESNNCPIAPNALAVQASCTISVTYTPTLIGSENGTITVNDNALPSPQTASVSGSSVSAGIPTLSPATLTFPTTLIGQSSTPQTATLTNTGTGALGIQNIYSYGDFPQTNNCPASLAVNASCTFTVTYTPSQQGNEYGYLYISTDSAYYQVALQMTGTGQAPVPTISALSLASVPAGSASTQITITGSGFVYGSQVLWNGLALPCCSYEYGNTQINVTIPAASLSIAGTYQISVFTPTPGGGTSNSLPFSVYTPINYAAKSATYSYQAITGTNLGLYPYSSAQIASPFAIQFGGGSYTNLTVGAGGTISFNGFSSEYNDVIPTTQTPLLIAPFWTYLFPFGTGNDNNVFWAVTGSAPNRKLVVEWRDVPYCCNYDANYTIKFEVVFFEGSSNILFNYADTVFGGPYSGNDNGATATSGVQVAPGVGTQYSYNQPLLMSKTALLWYPASPTATLSSSNLGFGYHQIGTRSLAQKVTLTNGGVATLVISSIATDNADFTQTNNCNGSLASHKSCSIHVFFTPSQPFSETATLAITDNAANSPQTAALTGIGTITPIVVYPIMANFGSVKVGTTSTLPVVLANGANRALSIQQITASPSVYTETNNCGSSLAPGASCTVSVTFAPVQQGNVSGKLSMSLNGKPVVTEVKLVGSGQ
jgi:Right handed beta helix region/Abnormal spindle-like microcephaly-assoc'd, ASPM-SPD-2-Hydin